MKYKLDIFNMYFLVQPLVYMIIHKFADILKQHGNTVTFNYNSLSCFHLKAMITIICDIIFIANL